MLIIDDSVPSDDDSFLLDEPRLKPLIMSPVRPTVIPSYPTYRVIQPQATPTNPTPRLNMKARLFWNLVTAVVRRRLSSTVMIVKGRVLRDYRRRFYRIQKAMKSLVRIV
jgi:hypothetical protein